MHNIIKSIASILQQLPSWAWDFVTIMATIEISIPNAIRSCAKLCQQISCIRVKFLREIGKVLHTFFIERTFTSVHAFTVFAHLTIADLTDFDPLSSFDTDSSSWVCDNLATGHICNNKALFADELVPSIFQVGSQLGYQFQIRWVL
jgi:hypothetical protein